MFYSSTNEGKKKGTEDPPYHEKRIKKCKAENRSPLLFPKTQNGVPFSRLPHQTKGGEGGSLLRKKKKHKTTQNRALDLYCLHVQLVFFI